MERRKNNIITDITNLLKEYEVLSNKENNINKMRATRMSGTIRSKDETIALLREEIARLNAQIHRLTSIPIVKQIDKTKAEFTSKLWTIIHEVSGIPIEKLKPDGKKAPSTELANFRFIAAHLLHKHVTRNLTEVSALIGYKNHTSVMYANDQVNNWLDHVKQYHNENSYLNNIELLFVEFMWTEGYLLPEDESRNIPA